MSNFRKEAALTAGFGVAVAMWAVGYVGRLPAILLPRLNWPGALLVLAQCACVVCIIAILESRDE